jgi:hypothetical protein
MTDRTDSPSSGVILRAMKRDRFTCTYCGKPGTDVELQVDHIIPVSKGGSHHIANLTTACRHCNQSKGNREAPPRATETHNGGLVGMWLHTFADEEIDWQGRVVGMDGDIALVQLFSWLDGQPTKIEPIPKSVIYSDDCNLYADSDAMNTAYLAYTAREAIKNGN